MNSKVKTIINIIGFYIGWWACVLGAANDLPYFGPTVMILFLIVHYYLFMSDIQEIYLVLIIGTIGTITDSLLFLSGSFIYAGAYSNEILIAPMWITAMWAGFAATVNHSMSWLKDKWLLMVICGVVFGPVAFFTGEKFGAIEFHLSALFSGLVIAIVYGISMPAIYFLNRHLGLDS